jgi:hypothetical protein
METILTKTITEEQLNTTYNGDTIILDNELRAEFNIHFPGNLITETMGCLVDNGDATFTYSLTVEYTENIN